MLTLELRMEEPSTRVNKPENDDAGVLEPFKGAVEFSNQNRLTVAVSSQRFTPTGRQASMAFSMRVERLIWEVLRVLHHLHHVD